jgi:type IV conjugative transfer system coupling protein TraD
MLNNIIGGGQVFLHKVRMFRQVLRTAFVFSILAGVLITWNFNKGNKNSVDWDGAVTYVKAKVAITLHPALSAISIGKSKANFDAYSNGRLWKKRMLASSVLSSSKFNSACNKSLYTIKNLTLKAIGFGVCTSIVIFLFWNRFGRSLKEEKTKEGSGVVLTSEQVRRKLGSMGQASDFKIGKMPLVKNMETRHFLVTGATGCGKTNLMHNMLIQVEEKSQPAVIIDQTGEMIAKYYNPERGDIIFNPFDERGQDWNLWEDCSTKEELERFSKILIGFNRKQSGSNSDTFWENSAEVVFNACVEYLRKSNATIKEIANLVCKSDVEYLRFILAGTDAARYLSEDSKQTSSSILSVLAANSKPITYLSESSKVGSFSMNQYFKNVKNGSKAWLFLSTKPSSRSLTLPLIACLVELSLAKLMDIGIDKNRRVWFVIDELAALGKLPGLPPLMSEGRKYGAGVIAGVQSLNQLYSNYGHYDGSTIFGQFGTSFFFRNTEPAIAKMFASMCGTETIIKHQKNTSFGANEFRDGVSYNEQEQRRSLVEPSELAKLAIGECFTLFPEPAVRICKVQVPEKHIKDKVTGFQEKISKPKHLQENNKITTVADETDTASDEITITPLKKDIDDDIAI